VKNVPKLPFVREFMNNVRKVGKIPIKCPIKQVCDPHICICSFDTKTTISGLVLHAKLYYATANISDNFAI
jgi:hypothetical protein